MGSGQSSHEKLQPVTINPKPIISNNNDEAVPTINNNNTATSTTTTTKKKKKEPPKNLTGFALVEYKCRKKRAKYDNCYKYKHSAFVAGSRLTDKDGEVDETSCEDLFDAYKDCIYKGMLKDRKGRGVASGQPESALGDFDDDED